MTTDAPTDQVRLMAGLLSHLARYLETGCPRAAHEAGMLLRELDARPLDKELLRSCEQLEQAMANSQPPCRHGRARGTASISTPPRSRSLHACTVPA